MATLFLGMNSGKEYAEFEWPLDIAVAILWIAYAVVFFGTIAKRKVRPIYVSNWFYGALIIVLTMLHVVNSLALPVGIFKSYSVYAGSRDAIVQWWYGHNAVGFFLTGRLFGDDVLFSAQASGAPHLELSLVDYRFLGFCLHLHLGRAAPFALFRDSRLGAKPRRGDEHYFARAVVGDDGERDYDDGGGVAKTAHRAVAQIHRAVAGVLRIGDIRRPDDGD